MESTLSAFGTLANIIGTLHPAAQLVNQIYQVFARIQHNRSKCRAVCERARYIITAINDGVKDGRIPEETQSGIDRLMSDLHFVLRTMTTLSEMNFLRSLLRHQSVADAIDSSNSRLSDTVLCFSATASIKDSSFREKFTQARREDAEDLERRMLVLSFDDSQLLRNLEVKQNEIADAMLAIQKQISQEPNETIERKALQQGLGALQRQSNRMMPTTVPDWLITAYDIDVDPFSELGKGSFSVIGKATWNHTQVAVKQMTSDVSEKILLDEIKIWRKLRHPHVLPFYGASITSDPPFIVSHYMENGNLVAYLRKYPGANRVQLIHEVSLGLAYIHSMNIVHGDLKGYNVLINDGGKACLADFGLSRLKQDYLSRTQTTAQSYGVGTLRFMAPEVMNGTITPAGDIYSFGMVMFEAFTDEAPFSTIPDAALYVVIAERQRRLARPASTEVAKRGLSDDMWRLLSECTEPKPQLRPLSANVSGRTKQLSTAWIPASKSLRRWDPFEDEAFGSAVNHEVVQQQGNMRVKENAAPESKNATFAKFSRRLSAGVADLFSPRAQSYARTREKRVKAPRHLVGLERE